MKEKLNDELVARIFGVTSKIMRQVQAIKEAAKTDPEIAAALDEMDREEASGGRCCGGTVVSNCQKNITGDVIMEDFSQEKIRKVPRTELKRQQNYMDLLPRPSEEEYKLLKESIEQNGFQKAHPILINDDDVVLDGYTRLQIADELNEEWVWVQTLELEDHFDEKLFIIDTNLVRRHLNTHYQALTALQRLEIEKERAKERQLRAGGLNLKQNHNIKENISMQGGHSANDEHSPEQTSFEDNTPYPVGQKIVIPDKGRAMEALARRYGINRETLRQVQKIEEAAQIDPKIADARDKSLAGETSINQVYQQVQEKQEKAGQKPKKHKISRQPQCNYVIREEPLIKESFLKRMTKKIPASPPFSDEKIMRVIYGLAKMHGISKEDMDAAIAWERAFPFNHGHSYIVQRWRWWSQKMLDADVAWSLCELTLNIWRKQQRALRPEEVPVPDHSKKLGPWTLDFVHQAQLQDLVREFPAESVHLIYSDALVEELDQLSLLGKFAARVLNKGKYLCVCVDKLHLPEAMARLSAAGLTYFWTCMVFRPADKIEVQGRKMRDKCRLLLIYRKGDASEGEWDWFEDAVEERRPSNRGMIRQLLKGLTIKGQMVVDPFVGSGVTGQAARSLGRRFLCFGADEENVRATNQRITALRLAEESGSGS
jgi:disulfide oxidoreductase YuzD